MSIRSQRTALGSPPVGLAARGGLRGVAQICRRWGGAHGPRCARTLLFVYGCQHLVVLALARGAGWRDTERWAPALRWPFPVLLLVVYAPGLWLALRGLSPRRQPLERFAWVAASLFALLHGGARAYRRWEGSGTPFDSLAVLHATASSVDGLGVPWVALGLASGASGLFVALGAGAGRDTSGRLACRAQLAASLVLIVLAALTVVSYATGG